MFYLGDVACRNVGCMRKRNFKKYLFLLAFVVFPLAGYLTVGGVRVCRAQVCGECGVPCIAPNSLAQALDTIYSSVIQPALDQATNELVAYMDPNIQIFNDGIQPVLDWTQMQIAALYNTLWYYNLLPEMQDMTRELTQANTEQAEALGAFADAANMNRVNATLADLQIKDHRALRPDNGICMAGTMMSGMARASAFSNGYLAAADVGKIWRSANDYDTPARGGMATDMQYEWQHKDYNGNPAGYAPTWCNMDDDDGNAGCASTGTYPGEDVDVAGMIFGEDTIPLTTSLYCKYASGGPGSLGTQCNPMIDLTCRQKANPQMCSSPAEINLDQMVINLAEPFVKNPVTANPAEGGKSAILASVAYKAKRQVVYDGLDYVISRKVPAGLSYDSEQASNQYTNNQSFGYTLPDPPANYAPGFQALLMQIRALTGEDVTTSPNPSRDEILRALMTQRFQSGMYALSQINEPENDQREMVVDQALQVIQLSDDLDIMDHEMLLLASQVGNEVESQYSFGAGSEAAPVQ